MTVYESAYELAKDLPSDRIHHRISCDMGQVRSGKSQSEPAKERVRAYRDILAERGLATESQDVKDEEIVHPIEYHIAKKYQALYESARRRGKEFNLSLGDVRRLMERKTCAYTGVKLTSSPNKSNSRTVDRLDSTKGYVKGNVFAISYSANLVKNALFEDDSSTMRMPLKESEQLVKTLVKMGFVERD